jgi:hypothetical protein
VRAVRALARVPWRVRDYLALYVGGMGAPGRNFYNSLVRRYGFEQSAAEIEELYRGDPPGGGGRRGPATSGRPRYVRPAPLRPAGPATSGRPRYVRPARYVQSARSRTDWTRLYPSATGASGWEDSSRSFRRAMRHVPPSSRSRSRNSTSARLM